MLAKCFYTHSTHYCSHMCKSNVPLLAGQIRVHGLDPPHSGELTSLSFRVWGTLCYSGILRRDLPALHHRSSSQKGTFRFTVTQDSAAVPSVSCSLSPVVVHTDGPIRSNRARRGSMVSKSCSVQGVWEAPLSLMPPPSAVSTGPLQYGWEIYPCSPGLPAPLLPSCG